MRKLKHLFCTLLMAAFIPITIAADESENITSIADLEGEYFFEYHSQENNIYWNQGNMVTVSQIEGVDSIAITGFWNEDGVLKAKIDIDALTISIPNQVFGTYNDNECEIAWFDYDESEFNRDNNIDGTINKDGTITIIDYWCICKVDAGTSKYIDAFGNSVLQMPNATMTYHAYNEDSESVETYTAKMVVTEAEEGLLYLKNFAGYGRVVTLQIYA